VLGEAGEAREIQAISSVAMLTLENVRPFDVSGISTLVKVLRVVDGDTLIVGAILFGERWAIRCRCAGFNCAELKGATAEERADAQAAKAYVERVMLGQVVPATFRKNDKYGRALAVFGMPDGRDMCAVMIAEGLAMPYVGRTRAVWPLRSAAIAGAAAAASSAPIAPAAPVAKPRRKPAQARKPRAAAQ
jgi:endonuclease YncB( thermonuclease family)